MRDQDKSKDQLIRELCDLRKQTAEILGAEGKCRDGESLSGQDAAGEPLLSGGDFSRDLKKLRSQLAERGRAERDSSKAELVAQQCNARDLSLTDEILDILLVGICIVDSNFRIAWANNALEDFLGLRRTDLIGRDSRKIIQQRSMEIFENGEEFIRKILASYENNTYVEHFECHVLANGRREDRWLEHWSQPIQSGLYAGGRVEHYYDITEHRSAENVLRTSGHFLRTIISSVNEGIIVYDRELRYQLWNEFMERLTGMPARHVLGKSTQDFFPHLEKEGVFNMMRRALEGETVRSGDVPYHVPQTGKKGWVTGVYSPRIDYNGKILGVVATIHDISERKRSEQKVRESEEKYRSIFNAAQDAIVIVDQETGMILDVNESACKLYGYTLDEMLTMKSFETSAEPEQTIEAVRTRANKIPLRYHKKKDGTVFAVEISASYYLQNGNCLGTALIRDITERKMAEEALEASERKLRYLTSKLITAREQEQKRISKELHDELGQALLALKLQARSIEQKLGSEQRNLRDKCLEMLRYIDEVVENVHRLSRDLSPLILENLGLTSALRWLTEEFTKRTRVNSSIEMENIEDILTPTAQTLIYRIFQECLTNIAKHAHASQMTLVVRREGEVVKFQVEDDGRGFDPEKVSDSRAPDKGLGLAAMVERVRMLGGTLDVSSRENEGAKITFTLPVNNKRKASQGKNS